MDHWLLYVQKMTKSNYQNIFPSPAAKVSVCDSDRAVQQGLLNDSFFENTCVFSDVLNQVDAKSRKELEESQGPRFKLL